MHTTYEDPKKYCMLNTKIVWIHSPKVNQRIVRRVPTTLRPRVVRMEATEERRGARAAINPLTRAITALIKLQRQLPSATLETTWTRTLTSAMTDITTLRPRIRVCGFYVKTI